MLSKLVTGKVVLIDTSKPRDRFWPIVYADILQWTRWSTGLPSDHVFDINDDGCNNHEGDQKRYRY